MFMGKLLVEEGISFFFYVREVIIVGGDVSEFFGLVVRS